MCRKKLLANENLRNGHLNIFSQLSSMNALDNAIIGICRSQQNWDDQ